MPKFKLDIDDFCDELFHELERISEGKEGHVCEIESLSLDLAGVLLSWRLSSFIKSKLEVVDD